MNKRFMLTFIIVFMIGCTDIDSDKKWVEIDPIQCLGNPWEVDWLQDDDFDNYPWGDAWSIEEPEKQIIKQFYGKQGITIFDVKSEVTHEEVCEACNCPQGYTLYLQISEDDTDKMLGFGYRYHDNE